VPLLYRSGCRPNRSEMIRRILDWQARQRSSSHEDSSAPTPTLRRVEASQLAGRSEGSCAACGQAKVGVGTPLCACPLVRMDPVRPVLKVHAFASFRPTNRQRPCEGSARLVLEGLSVQGDEQLELRLSHRRFPTTLDFPKSLTIYRQGSDEPIFALQAPSNVGGSGGNNSNVRKAPVCLHELLCCEHSDKGISLVLEAYVDDTPHLAQDWLVAVVCTGPPQGFQSLVEQCSKQPAIDVFTSRRLHEKLGKLNASEESDEIRCATPMKQSLICPISRSRMHKPCRGTGCPHLGCMDLEAYISSSLKLPFRKRWRCPICDGFLPPSDLRLCSWTFEQLEQQGSNSAEVPLSLLMDPPAAPAAGATQAVGTKGPAATAKMAASPSTTEMASGTSRQLAAQSMPATARTAKASNAEATRAQAMTPTAATTTTTTTTAQSSPVTTEIEELPTSVAGPATMVAAKRSLASSNQEESNSNSSSSSSSSTADPSPPPQKRPKRSFRSALRSAVASGGRTLVLQLSLD